VLSKRGRDAAGHSRISDFPGNGKRVVGQFGGLAVIPSVSEESASGMGKQIPQSPRSFGMSCKLNHCLKTRLEFLQWMKCGAILPAG
jgi:hypothetical protein